MTSPRKRFAWIETSLLREEWPNEVRLALVLLLCVMTDRWASDKLTAEQASVCRLSAGELCDAMGGVESLEEARRILAELAAVTSLRWTARGTRTEIRWPKTRATQRWERIDTIRASDRKRKRQAASFRMENAPSPTPSSESSSASSSASASSTSSLQTPVLPGSERGRAGRVVGGRPPELDPPEPIAARVARTIARLDPDAVVRNRARLQRAVAALSDRELDGAVQEARVAYVDGQAGDPVAYFIGIAARVVRDRKVSA